MDDIEKIHRHLDSIAHGVTLNVVEVRNKGIPIVNIFPHYRYVTDCDLRSFNHRSQRAEPLHLPKVDPRIEYEILTDPRQAKDIDLLRKTIFSLRGGECPVPVQKFQREVIEACVFSDTPSERISELVERYTYDLLHEDPRVRYTAYLTGLLVSDETVKLAPNVSLRPPEKSDFEETVPIASLTFDIPSPRKYLTETGSVLEVVFDSPDSAQNNERIEAILEGLRVYFGRPIHWGLLIRTPYSFYNSRSLAPGKGRSRAGYHAELGSDGIRDLVRFFSDFDEKLSAARTIGHVRIALEKYSGGLAATTVSEKEIADAIMGLEGLFFVSSKERSEMKKRLELRTAELLAAFGFDRDEVRRTVQKAYEIRTVYAHGEALKPEELARISREFGGLDKIYAETMRFLRLSLLAIIFSEAWEKDKFVRIIEEALRSETGRRTLKEMVQLLDYIDT